MNAHQLAQYVANTLSSYHAVLRYLPEWQLEQLSETNVSVLPNGTKYQLIAKDVRKEISNVQICILQRGNELDGPSFLNFVYEIAQKFPCKRFENAICTNLAFKPLSSTDLLRSPGVFAAVVELTFTDYVIELMP